MAESQDKEGILNPRSHLNVVAFIDWNSQVRAFLNGDTGTVDPVHAAQNALKQVVKNIARCLNNVDPAQRFSVSLRLYHGWHKGFEPSLNRRAITRVIAETDFVAISPRPNIIFRENVAYGDRLIAALPGRLHGRLSIHLPNTLRDRLGGRGEEEKMVDTALAADIVVSAFQDPNDWILVASEDDDLVPPLFSAEAIIAGFSSRVLLVSNRKRSSKFINLDNMVAQ